MVSSEAKNENIFGEVAFNADRELFLLSQRHETLKYWTGQKRATQKAISTFKQCLLARRRHAFASGASGYLHIVAPDKHVVYEDVLPFKLEYSLGMEYQKNISKDIFLYPLEELKSALPSRIYMKTDSHWAGYGNALIATLIAHRMGYSEDETSQGHSDLMENLKVTAERHSGDLGRKLEPPEHESLSRIVPSWQVSQVENLTRGNEGTFSLFLSEHPKSRGKLLIFGDSFMFQSLPALSRYFKEILCCRSRNYHHELVTMSRPDFIVTENVERYLSSPGDDRTAPPFFLMAQLIGRDISYTPEAAAGIARFLSAGNLELQSDGSRDAASGADS